MYALKLNGSFTFTCVSSDLNATRDQVNKAFGVWKRRWPEGNTKNYRDFMVNRTIVKLSFDDITLNDKN